MPLSALPDKGNTDWYPYATALHGTVAGLDAANYISDNELAAAMEVALTGYVTDAELLNALNAKANNADIYTILQSDSRYIRTVNGNGPDANGNVLITTQTGSGGAVTTVQGRIGDVTITKTDLGIANVDNTTDLQKPVSTATQTALNAKAPTASPTFTGTVSGVTKAHVGLGNVDNTSDAAKPISTLTATALAGKASTSHTHTADQITDGTNNKVFTAAEKTKLANVSTYVVLEPGELPPTTFSPDVIYFEAEPV